MLNSIIFNVSSGATLILAHHKYKKVTNSLINQNHSRDTGKLHLLFLKSQKKKTVNNR